MSGAGQILLEHPIAMIWLAAASLGWLFVYCAATVSGADDSLLESGGPASMTLAE